MCITIHEMLLHTNMCDRKYMFGWKIHRARKNNTWHISPINTTQFTSDSDQLSCITFFFSFFFSFVLFHFIFFIIFFLWLNLTVGSLSLPVISLTVELEHLGYRCIGDWQPWRPVIPTFSLWFHFPSIVFFFFSPTVWLLCTAFLSFVVLHFFFQ